MVKSYKGSTRLLLGFEYTVSLSTTFELPLADSQADNHWPIGPPVIILVFGHSPSRPIRTQVSVLYCYWRSSILAVVGQEEPHQGKL